MIPLKFLSIYEVRYGLMLIIFHLTNIQVVQHNLMKKILSSLHQFVAFLENQIVVLYESTSELLRIWT